jgi:putative transposase
MRAASARKSGRRCSLIDRSPRQVYAILLERGTYLCSVRTMYRILAEQKAVRERRPQRNHPEQVVPRRCATAPNQLWSWDITKLLGFSRSFPRARFAS